MDGLKPSSQNHVLRDSLLISRYRFLSNAASLWLHDTQSTVLRVLVLCLVGKICSCAGWNVLGYEGVLGLSGWHSRLGVKQDRESALMVFFSKKQACYRRCFSDQQLHKLHGSHLSGQALALGRFDINSCLPKLWSIYLNVVACQSVLLELSANLYIYKRIK